MTAIGHKGINVNNLDNMLERNKDFAARQSAAGTLMPSLPRALPNVKAIIIGCADMRVDPAHVLGIKPGEAVVIRNIGGRITPGLLEQLGLLGHRSGCRRDSWRRRGVSHHRTSAHRLRHDSACGRPRHADALFSNTKRGTQGQSDHRSSRGGGRRRCLAPGDSGIAGRVACIRPRIRRSDRSCRSRRTARADSRCVNINGPKLENAAITSRPTKPGTDSRSQGLASRAHARGGYLKPSISRR